MQYFTKQWGSRGCLKLNYTIHDKKSEHKIYFNLEVGTSSCFLDSKIQSDFRNVCHFEQLFF